MIETSQQRYDRGRAVAELYVARERRSHQPEQSVLHFQPSYNLSHGIDDLAYDIYMAIGRARALIGNEKPLHESEHWDETWRHQFDEQSDQEDFWNSLQASTADRKDAEFLRDVCEGAVVAWQ